MILGIKDGNCWYCNNRKAEAQCIYCTKCRQLIAKKEIKSVLNDKEEYKEGTLQDM